MSVYLHFIGLLCSIAYKDIQEIWIMRDRSASNQQETV